MVDCDSPLLAGFAASSHLLANLEPSIEADLSQSTKSM